MRRAILPMLAGAIVLGAMAMAAAQPQRMGPGMGPGPMMQGQGPMMHGGPGMGPGMRHGMGGHGPGMMGFDRIEGRIAFLAAEIKITDKQRPQWDAFVKVLRDTAQAHKSLHETMHQAMMGQNAPSWPDRLGLMQQMMGARLDQLKTLKAAAEPLYAVLTKEQKETADELLHGPMGMM